jgi:hypothetical protein
LGSNERQYRFRRDSCKCVAKDTTDSHRRVSKGSRGGKILIRVFGYLEPLYVIGKIEDGFLVYKVYKKERRIALHEGDIYQAMGVNWADVHGEKNAVINYRDEFKAVEGFDAVRVNDLYKRALFAPKLDDMIPKITLIVCIITLLVILGLLYFTYSTNKNTKLILEQAFIIRDLLANQSMVIS